jgi:hypothetical protein
MCNERPRLRPFVIRRYWNRRYVRVLTSVTQR